MSEDKSLDILGIKPIGEAINTTVKKSFDGIESFLKIVCVPALEEVGLLLKDHVRNWRLNNILKMLEKAQDKLEFDEDNLQIKAHPRVALSIIENSSLIDNDDLQELWAGLFVSSCTKDGQDDENLIFVDLLKQITTVEAKIIKYGCKHARKVYNENGLFVAAKLKIETEDLYKILETKDLQRIDRELDHLRSLNLIGSGISGGFSFDSKSKALIADITPTALALNLYMKSNGIRLQPKDYWTDNLISAEEYDAELKKEWGLPIPNQKDSDLESGFLKF